MGKEAKQTLVSEVQGSLKWGKLKKLKGKWEGMEKSPWAYKNTQKNSESKPDKETTGIWQKEIAS